jgi:hypothetical protein
MKFKKVETEVLFEALENNTCFHGTKTDYLIASYIGAVEVVVGERWDHDEKSYETDYFLAVQLPSGAILGVDGNNKFSLFMAIFIQFTGANTPLDFRIS